MQVPSLAASTQAKMFLNCFHQCSCSKCGFVCFRYGNFESFAALEWAHALRTDLLVLIHPLHPFGLSTPDIVFSISDRVSESIFVPDTHLRGRSRCVAAKARHLKPTAGYYRFSFDFLSPACPKKVRVGENSPNL